MIRLLTSLTGFAVLAACASHEPNGTITPPSPPPLAETIFMDMTSSLPTAVRAGRSMEARAADFDNDGDLDIFVAREAEPNVLLINQGNAVFVDGSNRIPTLVHDHEDIAIGDFDKDGDIDVVVVSEDDFPQQSAGKHELYLNDGKANFTNASSRIPVHTTANGVVAGDVDADGDLDLILGNAGRESLLLNDGQGNFADHSGRIPLSSDITQDVALGDVDADKDLDLLIANDEGGANHILLNDGKGNFSKPATNLPLPKGMEVTRNADFADADGDGDLDIYFANAVYGGPADPQDRLLINNGHGEFTDETSTRIPVDNQSTFDADFVDIDKDGDLDIVTTNFPPTAQYVVLINQAGVFTDQSSKFIPPGISSPGVEAEPADYNSDGRIDLYFATFVNFSDRLLLARAVP